MNLERYCKLFITLFLVLYLMIATLSPPSGAGELSSFEIPIISIVEHGSFEAREEDYEYALLFFSDHKSVIENQYKMFLTDKDGRRYPWYFGCYALLCIPVFLLLGELQLNVVYTLPVTNALCLAFALWGIYHYWKADTKCKLYAILFFGMGEMSLWQELTTESYEVAMTSLNILASVFWLNRERKRAAVTLSLAGTMNATVMAFGIFMIVDYFYEIFVSSGRSWMLFTKNVKKVWKDILGYAVCFAPCLFPMIISYYLFGTIVTMQSAGQVNGIWRRFFAYLVDLNFGLFPYIPFLLPLFAFVCLRSKEIWLKWTFAGVIATIFSYSLVFHINCGMPSIHRYNEWLLPIIVMTTIAHLHFFSSFGQKIIWGIACFSLLWCAYIMRVSFGVNHISWLPLARTVLDHAPWIYNPLPSTFNSRTNHIDGGYEIKELVIYSGEDGYVRKVLVPLGMAEEVRRGLYIPPEADDIFAQQYEKVRTVDAYTYLNFPCEAHILKMPETYTLREEIFFDGTSKDGHRYFLYGISMTENDFAWTDGKRALFRLRISEPITTNLILTLNIKGVFYQPQRLIAFCGGNIIFDQPVSGQLQSIHIQIPKECVLREVMEISFEFPDAISPNHVSENEDCRELAFALTSFSITKGSEAYESHTLSGRPRHPYQ